MPELKERPELDAAAARDWIERWDRQQEVYMPDREDRFTALIDAVVSTTALHWLSATELRDLYAALAGLLRPGGVFLDGDHFREDQASSPVLDRLDRVLEEREAQRRYPDGHDGRAEDWEQWWQSVAADPALAEAAAERARGHVHHGSEG